MGQGLLLTLGLKPRKVTASVGADALSADDSAEAAPPSATTPSAPPPPTASPAQAKADKLDADLGKLIDAISAALDQVHDDAAATAPRTDLAKLVDGRAKAQAEADLKKRAAALTGLIAKATVQKAAADKLLKRSQAVERREAARKEIEVRLGEVTALVLGGINDDGLRDTINKELKKQQAAFAKADKIPDMATSEKALLAMKPAVLALLARAEKAKQVTDWVGNTWQPLWAKAKAAVDAVGNAATRGVLQGLLDKLDKDFKAKVAAADLAALTGTLLPALQRIEKTAAAITTGTTDIDARLASAAKLVTEMGADASQVLIDQLAELQKQKASTWPAGATLDEIEKSLKDFSDSVTALAGALAAMKTIFDNKKAFEKDRDAIKAIVDEAQAIRSGPAAVLSLKIRIDFDTAKAAVDAAVALPDWPKAKAALPELKRASLAVKKARDDERTFRAAHNPLLPDITKVRGMILSPGLPAKPAKAFGDADQAVNTPMWVLDWPAASAKLPALKTALKGALETLDDGKKFYTAFAAIKADVIAANMAWVAANTLDLARDNPKVAAAVSQFKLFTKKMDDEIAQEDWGDAKGILPDLQGAAKALVAVKASYDAARAPYDTARAAITGLFGAETAARKVSPTTSKEVNSFKQKRIAVDDAVNAGDFAKAIAALPAWQKSIDDLNTAQAAQDAAEAAFNTAWAGLTDYAEAKQLAAGPVPALAAAAKDFNSADNTITNAKKVKNWLGANGALPALQAAATQLVAGKGEFNKNIQPADETAFADKLKALEPRSNKASDAPVPSFVEKLQKTVRDRLADIQAAVGTKDYAAAEAHLVKLNADLAAMEAGKARYAAHLAKFNTAKNGDIAAARALALAPPALAAERNSSLAAAEADIVALADKDKIAQADAAITRWLAGSRGWKDSQKAYAELHNGKVPDVSTLEDLAKKPGGEQVLDTLILKLPPATPAKVMNAALKARFGFEVKRFADMNADETNLKGLTAKDPEQPDNELREVYKLLAKIPNKQIKGKIKEMIDFDVDQNAGVYYGHNKKIYVYAGRVGNLADGTEVLGKKGEVMPEGEEVDESCKPDETTPPVPRSDFTLLHEAAHAEDRGTGFMDTKGKDAAFGGWRVESPKSIAEKAALHLSFDKDYIHDTLKDKDSQPPNKAPKPPKGVSAADWEKRRQAAVAWCQSIRAANGPWWKGALCKQVAIGDRVYQESYNDGRWSSYLYAARAKGISGYQFRAPPEWFAELYAAFFADKLKPSNPAMAWLKNFKPPSP